MCLSEDLNREISFALVFKAHFAKSFGVLHVFAVALLRGLLRELHFVSAAVDDALVLRANRSHGLHLLPRQARFSFGQEIDTRDHGWVFNT